MIRDTDQTICHVQYQESADGDDIASDWPTALQIAIDHFEVDDPQIRQMSCGLIMLFEETEDAYEDDPRVSITERSIKEEQ